MQYLGHYLFNTGLIWKGHLELEPMMLFDQAGGNVSVELLSNLNGSTQHLEAGEYLGKVSSATVVEPPPHDLAEPFTVTSDTE